MVIMVEEKSILVPCANHASHLYKRIEANDLKTQQQYNTADHQRKGNPVPLLLFVIKLLASLLTLILL